MDELAIIFYILLHEAMQIELEETYDTLYASVFNKFEHKIIENKFKKIKALIDNESPKVRDDIMIDKDRQRLKNKLKNIRQRP